METERRIPRTIPYLRIAGLLVLAIALVIGGVMGGIRLTHAASSVPELYGLRTDGSIWAYTGSGWQQLGSANSLQTNSIVAAPNALFQLHVDGSIWRYTGTPLTGWQQYDTANGSKQFSVSIEGKIYQRGSAGEQIYLSSRFYTGWRSLGTTGHGSYISAGPEVLPTGVNGRSVAKGPDTYGVLYAMGSDGVWIFYETAWQQIDTNPSVIEVKGTPNQKIYQLRNDSTNGNSIWTYTGGMAWQRIDNAQNPLSIQVDGNSTLYQLDKNGVIWSYNGTSWTALPHNPGTSEAMNFKVSKSGDIYEILKDKSVWAYQAGAWQQIDNSGNTFLITTDAGDWGANAAG